MPIKAMAREKPLRPGSAAFSAWIDAMRSSAIIEQWLATGHAMRRVAWSRKMIGKVF